jgi:hypothetical protein
MLIGLIKGPVRLDTILYGRWPEKLLVPAEQQKKRPRRRADTAPVRLDHSIIF